MHRIGSHKKTLGTHLVASSDKRDKWLPLDNPGKLHFFAGDSVWQNENSKKPDHASFG